MELINTLATFGTFVVITATAIAAIVQLRHARSNNQIAAITDQFVISQLKIKLQDPTFGYQVQNVSARHTQR